MSSDESKGLLSQGSGAGFGATGDVDPDSPNATSPMRALTTLCLVAGASAALELKKSSFETEVKQSGKNAFVKFLAPW